MIALHKPLRRSYLFIALAMLLTQGFEGAPSLLAKRNTTSAASSERTQGAGDLDSAFGNGGLITTSFFGSGDGAAAVAIQPDGKIVAAGYASRNSDLNSEDFAVSRYNPDGSLDQTFGSGGKQTTDFFGFSDQSYRVAIQPDGKIVVVGHATDSQGNRVLAIARYQPDGSLDHGFGSGGKIAEDSLITPQVGWALTFDSDGRIVVVGQSPYSPRAGVDVYAFLILRYNPNGTPDQTFGSGGSQHIDFFGNGSVPVGVKVQSDGKIVAAGYATVDSGNTQTVFAVARFNPDGSLDQSFGSGGKQTTDFPGHWALGDSLAIQPDGKIVVGGYAEASRFNSPTSDFALVRYNQDGTPDLAFGSGGKQTTDFFGNCDQSFDLGLQSDGKIVLGGFAQAQNGDSRRDFAIARYNQDGNPDQTFGMGGKQVTDFFGGQDISFGLAIQPGDKIVLAGGVATAGTQSTTVFGLARYIPGSISPDFSVLFNPASITAQRGSKVQATLKIVRTGGFTGAVTVTPGQPVSGIKAKPAAGVTVTGDSGTFKIKVGTG
ncbi:MAG TPA: hypothetical protein VEZ90_00795, partial [Blastocatellia bacterium]|nr:hypothetical protein [Blastocatellia bacterium]